MTPTAAYDALRLERLHAIPDEPEPAPRDQLDPTVKNAMREIIRLLNDELDADYRAMRATQSLRRVGRTHEPKPITADEARRAAALKPGRTWDQVADAMGITRHRAMSAAKKHTKENAHV